MFPWIEWQRDLWRFGSAKRGIQREYKAKYAAAEIAGKSRDELWTIIEDRMRAESYVDEEIVRAETSYLYAIAYRLRVPAPDHADKKLWIEAAIGGTLQILTDKALSDFRAAIRRERNERWQYWELRLKVLGVVLTGLTGAIGALIGLVATFKR